MVSFQAMGLCQKGLTSWWKDHQKVVRIFFMNKNLSKSNKLWFPILPPYINDNCKKLTCNINLHLLFCIWMVPIFILGFGRHACLLQSSFHSLLKKHDICSLLLIYRGALAGSVVMFMFNQNHHLTYCDTKSSWSVCGDTPLVQF